LVKDRRRKPEPGGEMPVATLLGDVLFEIFLL